MKTIQLTIGGKSKTALIQTLDQQGIALNPLAESLLQSKLFQISKEETTIELTELRLSELGITEGINLLGIISRGQQIGLHLCPVETAPFLRLTEYEQTNSFGMEKKHHTPDDAVTVLSEILDEEVSFPKGFYLRKIEGHLWLRAYICDYEHLFSPEETVIFAGTPQ
ncbi:hypothetical protein [Enterococcus olivae]